MDPPAGRPKSLTPDRRRHSPAGCRCHQIVTRRQTHRFFDVKPERCCRPEKAAELAAGSAVLGTELKFIRRSIACLHVRVFHHVWLLSQSWTGVRKRLCRGKANSVPYAADNAGFPVVSEQLPEGYERVTPTCQNSDGRASFSPGGPPNGAPRGAHRAPSAQRASKTWIEKAAVNVSPGGTKPRSGPPATSASVGAVIGSTATASVSPGA